MIKRLILFTLLVVPVFGAYVSQRSITINHAQAGSTNTTPFVFPFRTTSTWLNGALDNIQSSVTIGNGLDIKNGDSILVESERMLVTVGGGTSSLTVTRGTGGTTKVTHLVKTPVTNIFLATVANGGTVQNTSGYDVIFSSSITCSSTLNFELESYATSGVASWHVQIASLSYTADLVIYVCYNNSSISTFQGNTTATWDVHFVRVYHLSVGNQPLDSTGNNNLTSSSTACPTGAGLGSGAVNLVDGCTNGTAQSGNSSTGLPTGSAVSTLEAWLGVNGCYSSYFITQYGGTGHLRGIVQQGCNTFKYTSNYLSHDLNASYVILPRPSWNYYAVSYDGTKAYLYYQGSILNAGGTIFADTTTSGNVTINASGVTSGMNFDEVRFSDSSRSPDYMLATYNAYKPGSTFFILGAAAPIPTGGSYTTIME